MVHSFLYYQLNTNIISDYTYDKWSYELAELMNNNKEIAAKSGYYNGFKNFDGSSGYDLPYSNPEVQSKGYQILRIHKERK